MLTMRTRHLLVLAGILAFAACRHPFVRNPDLRLLRSDGFSVEHPAVAPNGTEVYYLSPRWGETQTKPKAQVQTDG